MGNLTLAWRNARKGKTQRPDVVEFEKNLEKNLLTLNKELTNQTYAPRPLSVFILRDPKTRKIAKSSFRDRVVHHAIINVISPIFEPTFIYDSCANQKGKGTLFALKRFHTFLKKVTHNGKLLTLGALNENHVNGYCLKADVKHYFENVNHDILLSIISRKIKDDRVLWLIRQIVKNLPTEISGGGASREFQHLQRHASRQFNLPVLCQPLSQ